MESSKFVSLTICNYDSNCNLKYDKINFNFIEIMIVIDECDSKIVVIFG